MREFNCSIYRGGTSKGICFLKSEIPMQNIEQFLLECLGNQTRQIDGIGGANSLTSRCALVDAKDDYLEYTFAQVAIDKEIVDFKSNCGNVSSCVGPFAYDRGIITENMLIHDECDENHLCVRIFNTNTQKFIKNRFAIKGDRFDSDGDFCIAGAPNPASKIDITFCDPENSYGKGVLPTGVAQQKIATSFGEINISIVDAGAPLVFMNASEVIGDEIFKDLSQAELDKIEEVRAIASGLIGLASGFDARIKNPTIPKSCLIAKSEKANLAVRMMSMQRPHAAFAVTATVCTATAAKIARTLVQENLNNFDAKTLKLEHPSGILECFIEEDGVKIARSARLLMCGKVYTRSEFDV